jgi:ABC-type multidrug transport system permease subunit
MRILLTLIRKDLLRVRRNPWVVIINLALPLLITTLIAVAFRGGSSGSGMGTIKLAIVDEDESVLSSFLRGAFQQGQAGEILEPRVMSRTEALQQIKANEISAVVILPRNLAAGFLNGESGLKIELIKNPAQRFYPAIVEELLGVLVEGLNAVSVNMGDEFSGLLDVFKEDKLPDFLKMSRIYADLDRRAKALRNYLDPPLVVYETETGAAHKEREESRPVAGVFAFVLPGMASMFLLFIADGSMRDIFRESRLKTMDRFRTLHDNLLVFVVSKVMSALVVICLGGFILFFGSSLVFQFSWGAPSAIVALVVSYATCAAGLMALCAAIARGEKRADVINISIILGMAFMGGAFFSASGLPPFVLKYISPMLPNYWLIEAVRAVHSGDAGAWVIPSLKLVSAGLVMMVAGGALFRAQLSKGGRE